MHHLWGSKFFQFYAVFGKNWQNRMLGPPESECPHLGEILDPPLSRQWKIYQVAQVGVVQASMSRCFSIPSISECKMFKLIRSHQVGFDTTHHLWVSPPHRMKSAIINFPAPPLPFWGKKAKSAKKVVLGATKYIRINILKCLSSKLHKTNYFFFIYSSVSQ